MWTLPSEPCTWLKEIEIELSAMWVAPVWWPRCDTLLKLGHAAPGFISKIACFLATLCPSIIPAPGLIRRGETMELQVFRGDH